jgi:hypothetical protein
MKLIILLLTGLVISASAIASQPVGQTAEKIEFQDEIKPVTELKIFPNPVTGNKFSVAAGKEIVSVELVNIVGQKSAVEVAIKSAGLVEVTFKNRKQGVYLITVKFTDDSKEVRRLVVN